MPGAASNAKPFPWGALPRVSRADAEGGRALRAWAARFVRARSIGEVASGIVGTNVEVRVESVSAVPAPEGAVDGVAVLLVDGDDAALVEAEAPLAANLVALATRRDRTRVPALGAQTGPAIAGGFGAVVTVMVRRLADGALLRVVAAGPAPALASDVGARADAFVTATLLVRVGGESYRARVTVPLATVLRAPEPSWTRETLKTLGDVRIAVPVVACATGATAADVGTLRRGDAWLPGAWPLTKSSQRGGLAGPVWLAAPMAESGLCAALGEDGRVVLTGGVEPLTWDGDEDEEAPVGEEKDALVEAVGEVPVVVRVEIGVAEMRAREWAALGNGDVVALGRKVGDPVTLRVGGVAVARGELVDLDGEVGVRILGRAEAGA